MVRSDQHCQGGGGDESGSVRAGLHICNTVEEIDRPPPAVLAALG